MPRLTPEGDSSGGEDRLTLGALCSNTVLKTGHTVDIFVIGNNEGFRTNLKYTLISLLEDSEPPYLGGAHLTVEAGVVPLVPLVLYFLCTGQEGLA